MSKLILQEPVSHIKYIALEPNATRYTTTELKFSRPKTEIPIETNTISVLILELNGSSSDLILLVTETPSETETPREDQREAPFPLGELMFKNGLMTELIADQKSEKQTNLSWKISKK